jgi:hypothetical protein
MQQPVGAVTVRGNSRQCWAAGTFRAKNRANFLDRFLGHDRRKLGRPKTLSKCKIKACGNDAVSRDRCGTHYKQWDRAYGHLRCHWPDCRTHQDDGGRRMNGVFYCRRHENEHLRITPQALMLNLERLGHSLSPASGACWLWDGPINDGGYGTVVPEGANTAKWYAHRVAWGLLVGGHKPGLELDHRTCKRRNCVNPLHLEPVSKSINQRRKRFGPDWAWTNGEAATSPNIHEFAARHGLPMPDPGAPITTRKTECSTPRDPQPSTRVRQDQRTLSPPRFVPAMCTTGRLRPLRRIQHRPPALPCMSADHSRVPETRGRSVAKPRPPLRTVRSG